MLGSAPPAGKNGEGFPEESTLKLWVIHSFDNGAEKQVEMDPQTFHLPRIRLYLGSTSACNLYLLTSLELSALLSLA